MITSLWKRLARPLPTFSEPYWGPLSKHTRLSSGTCWRRVYWSSQKRSLCLLSAAMPSNSSSQGR
uniref:Uncharacterized protein n=1 Tax=Anguilla anguilla TaxID=7936 RepID=A0A0E9S029_ANGAN